MNSRILSSQNFSLLNDTNKVDTFYRKRILLSCILALCSFLCIAQNKKTDSILNLVKTDIEDTNKANHLRQIGNAYFALTSYDSAIYFYNKSIELSQKIYFLKGVGMSYYAIGLSYYRQNYYQKALSYYLKASKPLEDSHFKKGIGNCYNSIGLVYSTQSNYPKALEYCLKSLKVFEEIGNKKSIADCYGNMAHLYMTQSDYTKSLECYFKTLKICEETVYKDAVGLTYMGIGTVYDKQANYPKALEYYFKSLKEDEETNYKHGIGECYANISVTYQHQANYVRALEYQLKALKIFKEINNKEDIAGCYGIMSDLYNTLADYKKAVAYSDSSLQLSKEIGYIEYERTAYGNLATAYSKTNNYKAAYEAHVKFKALTDSIFNTDNSKQLSDLKTNFEVEKKEAELKAEQDKKDIITTAEKKRQTIILLLGSCVLLLVILFSALLYKRFRLTHQQKEIIEHKQKEITDSITYAQRLQQAILPPQEFINQHLPDNFLLYLPKDIVAGDFYWAEKINDLFFIAAADSTGHGVPGAMVSVICSNALNRSVNEFNLTNTGLILDKTRDLVIETFKKSDKDVKDGMDISLLCIDTKNKKIFWSGANNPLWYIENNKLKEIKADKQPIGKTDNAKPFTTHQIEYKENTTFYLFTDGYADQFGGAKGKKYKYKQLEENLLANSQKPLAEQKQLLEQSFNHWKGNLEQVDDVCFIGIKV